MNLLNYKAKKIISDYIKSELTKIDVNPGKCRFNYRCQMNAVHEAINHNDDKVAMCFYFDCGVPIIHFINIDKNGKYIDNTLGNWAKVYDYYLIRYIYKEGYYKINDIFTDYRNELQQRLPLYVSLLSDYTF